MTLFKPTMGKNGNATGSLAMRFSRRGPRCLRATLPWLGWGGGAMRRAIASELVERATMAVGGALASGQKWRKGGGRVASSYSIGGRGGSRGRLTQAALRSDGTAPCASDASRSCQVDC
jgi:hypothetical protein